MSLGEPGKRKRIPYKKGNLLPIEDEMVFIKNKCSERARKVNSIKPNLVFEVWFDQHYHIRHQIGDANGIREGIDPKKVELLILKSMKYLIAYSSFLKTFSFINHNLNGGRSNRIVLQQSTNEGILNVVIEAHLVNVDNYEITVKTAMRIDSFMLSDGQFALEIFDNESVLKRMERGSVREVYNL
jgi:hypothetical protein